MKILNTVPRRCANITVTPTKHIIFYSNAHSLAYPRNQVIADNRVQHTHLITRRVQTHDDVKPNLTSKEESASSMRDS